jgi:hypothetical protein
MNIDHYKHFCTVISKGPSTDCMTTVRLVLTLTGGAVSVDTITEWWDQWQTMKQAMRDNHPIVKLTAAMIGTAAPVPSPK